MFFRHRAVGTGEGRIFDDHTFGFLQGLPGTIGQLTVFKHFYELVTKTGLKGFKKNSGLIQQSNPCNMITAGFDQDFTGALQKSISIFFFSYQLIDIANSAEYEIELFQLRIQQLELNFRSFQIGNVAAQFCQFFYELLFGFLFIHSLFYPFFIRFVG